MAATQDSQPLSKTASKEANQLLEAQPHMQQLKAIQQESFQMLKKISSRIGQKFSLLTVMEPVTKVTRLILSNTKGKNSISEDKPQPSLNSTLLIKN